MNNRKIGWLTINGQEMDEIIKFNNDYIRFLDNAKTERLAVKEIEKKLLAAGFESLSEKESLTVGDKVYCINNNKAVFATVIGKESIENGINIIGSHIDSPRLDLKPNPLYEDVKLALFKTHYYGGIKKYQWTTIPLALHGVIYDNQNNMIEIHIGDDDNDPVFTITDLLPHLASKQNEKKLGEAISGEQLNILIGSIPNDAKDTPVRENILALLKEKYNIDEDSFMSAELEFVPAFKAKSLGFDHSMVGAYGQDDRVCAYTSLQALLETENPTNTAVAIFADKEEIGSMGNTGMMSNNFDLFVSELLEKMNCLSPNSLLKTFHKSKMLSADVGAGIDPNNKEVSDEGNASYIGCGIEITKYTGSKGKSGASDANAEFVHEIKNLFKQNNILYQFSELGKVDVGGGGTISFILANKGVNVLDCGVAVISMHSPFEVTSKFDVFTAYKSYKSFFQN